MIFNSFTISWANSSQDLAENTARDWLKSAFYIFNGLHDDNRQLGLLDYLFFWMGLGKGLCDYFNSSSIVLEFIFFPKTLFSLVLAPFLAPVLYCLNKIWPRKAPRIGLAEAFIQAECMQLPIESPHGYLGFKQLILDNPSLFEDQKQSLDQILGDKKLSIRDFLNKYFLDFIFVEEPSDFTKGLTLIEKKIFITFNPIKHFNNHVIYFSKETLIFELNAKNMCILRQLFHSSEFPNQLRKHREMNPVHLVYTIRSDPSLAKNELFVKVSCPLSATQRVWSWNNIADLEYLPLSVILLPILQDNTTGYLNFTSLNSKFGIGQRFGHDPVDGLRERLDTRWIRDNFPSTIKMSQAFAKILLAKKVVVNEDKSDNETSKNQSIIINPLPPNFGFFLPLHHLVTPLNKEHARLLKL